MHPRETVSSQGHGPNREARARRRSIRRGAAPGRRFLLRLDDDRAGGTPAPGALVERGPVLVPARSAYLERDILVRVLADTQKFRIPECEVLGPGHRPGWPAGQRSLHKALACGPSDSTRRGARGRWPTWIRQAQVRQWTEPPAPGLVIRRNLPNPFNIKDRGEGRGMTGARTACVVVSLEFRGSLAGGRLWPGSSPRTDLGANSSGRKHRLPRIPTKLC